MRWNPVVLMVGFAASAAPGAAPQSAPAPPRLGAFTDVSAEAGITVVGVCGPELAKKRWILEVNGGGAALFDADADGDLDLWLTNGSTLESLRAGKPGAGDTLWLNDGAIHFTDATAGTGIGGSLWGNGVAVGDADGDGDLDVFVAEFGPDRLFLNDGKARFRDVGRAAGLTDPRWSSSATFLDYDRDGKLDLFVANYLQFGLAVPPLFGGDSQWRGHPVMRGPRGLPKDSPALYRCESVGEGGVPRYADVTVESGIGAAPASYPLGVVALDYDLDGDDDLYVANDSEPNFLFENLGNGRFREVAEELGCAVDDHGHTGSGMGVAYADYAGTGRFGIVVTNFSGQANNLFAFDGAFFNDRAYIDGIGGPSIPTLGWGCQFFDGDFDGWLDLFVTNGHVYPEADLPGTDTTFAQRNQYFIGKGGGKLAEATEPVGLVAKRVHRGAAFGDLDGDGDVDAVATVLNGKPVVLRNDLEKRGAWVAFDLRGAGGRSPWGAVVRVRAGERARLAECQPGSSFQCSNDPRVRFGLGPAAKLDEVEVRWPSGKVEKAKDLPVNRVHLWREGEPPVAPSNPNK